MKIHVIVPHFRSHNWLACCYQKLTTLATGPFYATVVDMDREDPVRFLEWPVTSFDPKGMIGGHPLPFALSLGMKYHRDADITVTVDTDAMVLKQGWDDELRRLFADPAMVCAGINPRSDAALFANCPEWNWMAFRTDFWHREICSFLPKDEAGHDIGHLFRHAARRCGKKFKVWPMQSRPYADKGATFVGDSPDDLWAFHAFYSSRKAKDEIPTDERKWMLTDVQENEMRDVCRNYQSAKGK